jgi:hypothetical protein
MAHWRSIGGVISIPSGTTHHWQITYGNGRDVGVVVAAPNLHELVANVELIALDQGVLGRAGAEELTAQTHYTVKIRNAGVSGISYNLNIGDWQPDGGQAPAAHRIRTLPPGAGGLGVEPSLVAARRAKKKRSSSAARKRKAARRRR